MPSRRYHYQNGNVLMFFVVDERNIPLWERGNGGCGYLRLSDARRRARDINRYYRKRSEEKGIPVQQIAYVRQVELKFERIPGEAEHEAT